MAPEAPRLVEALVAQLKLSTKNRLSMLPAILLEESVADDRQIDQQF